MPHSNLTTADLDTIEIFAASQPNPYIVRLICPPDTGAIAARLHSSDDYRAGPVFLIGRHSAECLIVTAAWSLERCTALAETFPTMIEALSAVRAVNDTAAKLLADACDPANRPTYLN